MSTYEELSSKIQRRDITCGVLGLGYVGLPLAIEMGKAGLKVIGFEVSGRITDGVNAGESHIKDVAAADVQALPEVGEARGDDGHVAPQGMRRHLRVRADAAREDEGPRHELRRRGHGVGGRRAAPRPADRAREHDVSRHDARTDGAELREARAQGGRGLLPLFQPRARGSGQPAVADEEHAQGARRRDAQVQRAGPPRVRAVHRQGDRGQLARSGGAHQAPREHLPHDQHRPRERDGRDLRQARGERVGSDRGRGDQAVRLHEVHAGPGARRALHPARPASISRGRCARCTTRRA